MNTKEQAPECCPFCGAGIRIEKDGSQCRASRGTWVVFNCCTTWHQGYREQRQLQSSSCATAERERLTRERDEAKKAAETAMVELGQVASSRRDLLSRVKQLESDWAGWPDLQREWFGDKYAAMQPWDAVRARIEDSEASIKRLEEESESRWLLAQSAIGSCAEMSSRIKRLEEALEACAAIIGPRDKVTWATDEQVDHAWELYTKAKEAKS